MKNVLKLNVLFCVNFYVKVVAHHNGRCALTADNSHFRKDIIYLYIIIDYPFI